MKPVDNASVTFFRIIYGWLLASWAWEYLTSGRLTKLYVMPEFHFTYQGFDWVQPWSGNGMYYHFWALLLLSLLIAIGFFYRLSAFVFACLFTHFFLIEKTNYQNHYYLIALFSWLMVLLPLNRNISVDSWRSPSLKSEFCPAWVLWAIRFHVALPYFFGGVAKISPDWLCGQPMGIFLATKSDLPVIGSWLVLPLAGIVFSWLGFVFDLLIVPALLWKPTRWFAFVLSVGFHLSNSVLFNIHIFPWFMIAATTIFFDCDWPRRILGAPAVPTVVPPSWSWTRFRTLSVTACLLYVAFHCLWPLRHNFIAGEASWHERGHFFSWRMMLRAKEVGIGFAIVDPATGRAANVDHKQFLVPEQADKFARSPDMIRQMARFLADRFERDTARRPEVYAFALASLNGRKPQLMIDPNFDLASQHLRPSLARNWIVPLSEPFRSTPWTVPIEQWRDHVELPEFKFMQKSLAAPVGSLHEASDQTPQLSNETSATLPHHASASAEPSVSAAEQSLAETE